MASLKSGLLCSLRTKIEKLLALHLILVVATLRKTKFTMLSLNTGRKWEQSICDQSSHNEVLRMKKIRIRTGNMYLVVSTERLRKVSSCLISQEPSCSHAV